MKPLSVINKIDCVLLPLLLGASFLSALDKNSLAFAAVLGMNDDLKLHDRQYSWLGSIFHIGYLMMEFPTFWLLTRLPIGKYLGTSLILWGCCLCTMAAASSFRGLIMVRFFLGVFEAGLMPSCIVITAAWYRREEQPLRTALWFGPFSGIFGGILAYAIGKIETTLPTWKLLFLIYGGCTVVFGIACLLALPDNHDNAWFLSKIEREKAKLRTRDNQTGEKMQTQFNWDHVKEALKDIKYWTIIVFGICQSITNAGITQFSPLILSGFGYSKETTVLLSSPQGLIALIAQVAASVTVLYVSHMRCLLWVLSCFPALLGVITIQVVDVHTSRVAALVGLYLTGFYNVSWVLVMSLISSNTAGATKKSFVSVSMAISYAVGNMIGPQFFLDSQKPQYTLGIGAMIVAFLMMAVCGVVYWMACIHQNKVRERIRLEASPLLSGTDQEGILNGTEEVKDRTDFEIISFRYTY